jgi:hypothetical protein
MKCRNTVYLSCIAFLCYFAQCCLYAAGLDVNTDNAADYYVKAAEIMSPEKRYRWISVAKIEQSINEFKVFYSKKDIKNSSELFDLFHAGASQKNCDWKTDYTNGQLTELPQITAACQLSDFICSVTIEEFLEKNTKKSIELLIDSMVLSVHIAHERCLVGFFAGCRRRERCDKLGMQILERLGRKELEMLSDGLKVVPNMPHLSDKVLMEKDILITWIKNDPARFFRHIDANFETWDNGLGGYSVNDKPITRRERTKAEQRQKNVDYGLIDKYYMRCADAVKQSEYVKVRSLLDGINKDMKELPNSLTKQILLGTVPGLEGYYKQEQSMKSQNELFQTKLVELLKSK